MKLNDLIGKTIKGFSKNSNPSTDSNESGVELSGEDYTTRVYFTDGTYSDLWCLSQYHRCYIDLQPEPDFAVEPALKEEAIPEGVFWSTGRQSFRRFGSGETTQEFYLKWLARRDEFPQEP